MKTDAFEDELRRALDDRAGEVPVAAVDRLRQRNYRPRGHSGVALAGAGLAIAALAASGGAYLAGGTAGSGQVPAGVAGTTGPSIRLDGYTFTLPPGFSFKAAPPECLSAKFADPVKLRKGIGAGAVAHDACIQAALVPSQIKRPPGGEPIQFGHYHGYLVPQPQIHRFVVFADLSTPSKHVWLLVLVRNLSESQVVQMVDRALGQKICPPGRGEEVKGKSCP